MGALVEGLYPKKIGPGARGRLTRSPKRRGGETGASALASCVLPPMAMDGVYYASGLLAAMSLRTSESGAAELRVDLYDFGDRPQAGKSAMDGGDGQPTGASGGPLRPGAASARTGGVFCSGILPAPRRNKRLSPFFLSQYVTDLSGARRLVSDKQTLSLGCAVCDGSPLSKTGETIFSRGPGARVAEGPQILCKRTGRERRRLARRSGGASRPCFRLKRRGARR